jgi:hypothetical protein
LAHAGFAGIMARQRIGLTAVRFGAAARRQTSLDELGAAIALPFADFVVAALYSAAKGAKAWRPLAMFKALLLATWRDLSDVVLARGADRIVPRAQTGAIEQNGPACAQVSYRVKHFGQIDGEDRSYLVPIGTVRVIEPIVAGEHFLRAECAQCRIAEKRRGTGKMVDFGLPARLLLHPRRAGAPRLLISSETRFNILAACQNFA